MRALSASTNPHSSPAQMVPAEHSVRPSSPVRGLIIAVGVTAPLWLALYLLLR